MVLLIVLLHNFYSWDEWVPESRVLKYNDQALQKQKELLKAHEATTWDVFIIHFLSNLIVHLVDFFVSKQKGEEISIDKGGYSNFKTT